MITTPTTKITWLTSWDPVGNDSEGVFCQVGTAADGTVWFHTWHRDEWHDGFYIDLSISSFAPDGQKTSKRVLLDEECFDEYDKAEAVADTIQATMIDDPAAFDPDNLGFDICPLDNEEEDEND